MFGTNETWYHFLAIGKIGKTPELTGIFLANAKMLGRENVFYQMNKTGSFPDTTVFLDHFRLMSLFLPWGFGFFLKCIC